MKRSLSGLMMTALTVCSVTSGCGATVKTRLEESSKEIASVHFNGMPFYNSAVPGLDALSNLGSAGTDTSSPQNTSVRFSAATQSSTKFNSSTYDASIYTTTTGMAGVTFSSAQPVATFSAYTATFSGSMCSGTKAAFAEFMSAAQTLASAANQSLGAFPVEGEFSVGETSSPVETQIPDTAPCIVREFLECATNALRAANPDTLETAFESQCLPMLHAYLPADSLVAE